MSAGITGPGTAVTQGACARVAESQNCGVVQRSERRTHNPEVAGSSPAPATNNSLLLDLGGLTACCTDHALEEMYKALGDPPDDSIWAPHHDPYLRAHVEAVTRRGQAILLGLQNALFAWLGIGPAEELRKAKAPTKLWRRLTGDELTTALRDLEAKPRAEYTLDDWMRVIDWILQRYLPARVIRTEAEYLAVRAVFAGRIKAALDDSAPDAGMIEQVTAALPATLAEAGRVVELTAVQERILEFAQARSAELVADLGERVRHRMKRLILDHEEGRILRLPDATLWNLQSRMLDEFGILNRDWRRIALTETARNANEGFVASHPPGARLKRVEAYAGACPFCKSIHGLVFTVVAPAADPKDGWSEVWVGKTNVGRSASPRKRDGDVLVERTPDELWWPAAGVQHPHCFVSPEVKVYTDMGWVRIADIRVGSSVLTHMGRFRPVNWVLDGPTYNGEIVRLRVASKGRNLVKTPAMTPEHPVLTDSGWIAAGEVTVGSRVAALAKRCPTCRDAFVNLKHDHAVYCSSACAPRDGKNQYSTDDPEKLEASREVTRAANARRMAGMTLEQRRALTEAGRAVMASRGYAHLSDPANRKKLASSLSRRNYSPSDVDMAVASLIEAHGFEVVLQGRLPKSKLDARGKRGYWFPDMLLPEANIAVEIDGDYWHQNRDEVGKEVDIAELGMTLIRVAHADAKRDPAAVADRVCRIAMNHSGEYLFGHVEVVGVETSVTTRRRLYNFGVEEDESYIVAGGLVAHNCRGGWVRVSDTPPGVDPKFEKWLDAQLGRAQKEAFAEGARAASKLKKHRGS